MANKEIRRTPEADDVQFPFGRDNYKFLLIGIGIVILGFILMIGGGSEDPNEFSEEIFSTRRITIAPIVALIGYGVIFYAILKRKPGFKNPENNLE
jgi:hypothetical protein